MYSVVDVLYPILARWPGRRKIGLPTDRLGLTRLATKKKKEWRRYFCRSGDAKRDLDLSRA